MEKWKEFKKNIYASDLGRIRIVDGLEELITVGGDSEYRRINGLYVHRIIAECFCEKKAGCNIVNHLNGDKWDNRAVNLEWTDYAGNNRHAFESGLRTTFGENHWKSTEKEWVYEIYELKKKGKKVKDMKHIPLTRKAIQQIFSGQNWRHEYKAVFGECFVKPGIAHGSKSHNAISEEKVLRIYAMKKEGLIISEIAKEVNEKYHTVKHIFNGKNWKHLYKTHFN